MNRDQRLQQGGHHLSIRGDQPPAAAAARRFDPRYFSFVVIEMIAACAACVALEWISFLHEHKGIPITPWNPGLGLMFGLMVHRGAHFAVPLAIGVFLAETFVLKVGMSSILIAAISAMIGIGYALAAILLRRVLRIDNGLKRLRDLGQLLAAGIAGAFLVGLLLAALLIIDDDIERSDLFVTFLPMFIGDAIGIAVFAPIVLRVYENLERSKSFSFLAPGVELGLLAALIFFMIGGMSATMIEGASRFIFVLFIPVVLSAIRHGLDGACISLAATQLGLFAALKAGSQDAGAFTESQAQMLVLTITGLIVGVVVSERAALADKARTATIRLKELEIEAAQTARFTIAGGMASALAHEINQPITAARALARSAQHLIGAGGGDLARAEKNLREMVAQVDHASNIVKRMREFVQRGRPHVSTIDILAMIRNVASLVGDDMEQARIELDVQADNPLPPLYGDRTQLEQVLLNFMRNGIDAVLGGTPDHGRIVLGAIHNQKSGEVEFFVTDNGPGIPEDIAERIFTPMKSSKPQGLGLGLAICASIIQSHHGRIWLASRTAGRTEFRFSIPVETNGVT